MHADVLEVPIRWGPIPNTGQEGFFDDDTPDADLALLGGYASGKTSALMAKALKLSTLNAPLVGIWVVPDYAHIFDTILPTLESRDPATGDRWFLEPGEYHYHQTRHVLTWIGGGPIQFLTAENPDSIAGPNVAFAVVDEPGKMKQAAWRNTVARVREPAAKLRQRCVAGTPEGLNWLADYFGPDRPDSRHVYLMRTEQNTEMLAWNPTYMEMVRANATEAELAAYLGGQFVNMTGALAYSAFSAEQQMVPDLPWRDELPLRIAFDFNVDPMAAVIGQQFKGNYGPEFNVLEAIALFGSTVMDMCAEIVRRHQTWKAGVMVYGDQTASLRHHRNHRSSYDIITEMLSGIGPVTLCVPRQNPPVERRLNSVNRLCKDGRGKCRLWLAGDPKTPSKAPTRELTRSLQQTVKRSGTTDILKKPGETVSHLSDALGYWLDYEAPAQKPTTTVATIKVRSTSSGISDTLAQLRAAKTERLRKQLRGEA